LRLLVRLPDCVYWKGKSGIRIGFFIACTIRYVAASLAQTALSYRLLLLPSLPPLCLSTAIIFLCSTRKTKVAVSLKHIRLNMHLSFSLTVTLAALCRQAPLLDRGRCHTNADTRIFDSLALRWLRSESWQGRKFRCVLQPSLEYNTYKQKITHFLTQCTQVKLILFNTGIYTYNADYITIYTNKATHFFRRRAGKKSDHYLLISSDVSE
jgi:hypothetical protein